MAYRFRAGQPLAAEVVRVFEDEAASAVASLRRTGEARRDVSIHDARKSVKKLRALLRLVAHEQPKRTARAENARLREAGRRLSELRDAQAVTEAFAKVSADLNLPADLIRLAAETLEERKRTLLASANAPAVMREVSAELQAAAREASVSKLRGDGYSLIETGIKRVYKRGRRARAAAKAQGTAEAFHEWRKSVKGHWYHARLLAELKSERWGERAEQLKTLEGLLGDDHNLAVLAAIFADNEQLKIVCGKLEEVSRQHRTDALALGKSLYKDKWSSLACMLDDAHAAWPAAPPRKRTPARAPSAKPRTATA